jgi:hypothetical protein
MIRLKELKPEREFEETLPTDLGVEPSVKETVITGAPSQYVSDRNRERPQTPTLAPSSPLAQSASPRREREKRLLQTDASTNLPQSLSSRISSYLSY